MNLKQRVEELITRWPEEFSGAYTSAAYEYALRNIFPELASAYLALLDELEGYKETVSILQDINAVKGIVAGFEDMKAGRTIDLDRLDLLDMSEAENAALKAENATLRESLRALSEAASHPQLYHADGDVLPIEEALEKADALEKST